MEELFALALESRCAVWHDALALRGSDGTAEVRLAGLQKWTVRELLSSADEGDCGNNSD